MREEEAQAKEASTPRPPRSTTIRPFTVAEAAAVEEEVVEEAVGATSLLLPNSEARGDTGATH